MAAHASIIAEHPSDSSHDHDHDHSLNLNPPTSPQNADHHPHPQHQPAGKPARRGRYVDMKDSWSHGDDRRDRGRVDRGVRRSPSRDRSSKFNDRRPSPARDSKDRPPKSRPATQSERPPRDRSPERRRRSRSPLRDSREEVRERNRGRELLDTRGSDKPKRSSTHHSPSSSVKRRKTRSPSPPRTHKKSRRDTSRSPSRLDRGSEKRRPKYSPGPARRRSPDRKPSNLHREGKSKYSRDPGTFDRRGRSPSPRRERREALSKSEVLPRRERTPTRQSHRSRDRSPFNKYKGKEPKRERSPFDRPRGKEQKRGRSPIPGRRSPGFDRSGPANHSRSRQPSPQGPKFARERGKSPREDRGGGSRRGSRDEHPRDDYRAGKGKPKSGRPSFPSASGANSIDLKGKGARNSTPTPAAASGANSIEVKSDKMYGRGGFQGQQGYNQNPMQAAFPLKPQYNPGPHVDPRYSQSPQPHMTPNSYQGSPQHSPYGAGRGNYVGQSQFSPQSHHGQYTPNHYQQPHQQPYPVAPQGQYYNNAQSPPYSTPTGPMNNAPYQTSYRGNSRGYRGNNFHPRGGRGDHRGGRGGHFQNAHFNSSANNPNNGPIGMGRGQHHTSPQHVSPPQQIPATTALHAESQSGSQAGSNVGTPQRKTDSQPQPEVVDEEDAEDLFRPSKDLQVEDKEANKKKDEEAMPPPASRPVPTGPQSSKPKFGGVSFGIPKKSVQATSQKLDISQKLNSGPARSVQFASAGPKGPNSRNIPTGPASGGQQTPQNNASTQGQAQAPAQPQQSAPTTRKVKKIMKRAKEKPQLSEDFRKSDSVYYRKSGNDSVVGSGTYGKVYKGIHVYTKKMVALKKIRMEGERDGFPVTAVREIKLLQSLKHHNIVNLQEVMVEKNDCFMVFEYLSHDLTGLLNHPTFKLEAAHKKHLAKQMFEGLDYLHRRGVLHRDIKAANILVSSDGQLKIADFGLARFYAKRRQLDYTNRVITIWYRSPELLLGETQYGPAVDIWSAACVLVEIFTKHAIFPGDGGEISQLDKIWAVLGTPTKEAWPGYTDMAWFALLRPTVKRANVFAEKYKERVTPAAYDLLEAMFQYDPEKRPSASDVLEHPYFTTEDPVPRQATELAALQGDWHEFESKALRKENERREKEARRRKELAAKATKETGVAPNEKALKQNEVSHRQSTGSASLVAAGAANGEKAGAVKRALEAGVVEGERDAKRLQVAPPKNSGRVVSGEVVDGAVSVGE
ncbi:uncharacterized protein L3040_002841 [Drepanopeziza brunnea f. sp. 'multigermtubi']|uniref:uncharacterized protein n=1 Tax=Drepanopeziza brunnea f. sp. 'multigermtubi' TaxID=698441 RepID=UPI00238FA12E|nr:hypothetical protein L3040_002841 [Drepanopeziza brunnea f. sp. 'multigermtubi']